MLYLDSQSSILVVLASVFVVSLLNIMALSRAFIPMGIVPAITITAELDMVLLVLMADFLCTRSIACL